jgi:hypothetical protein
MSSVRSLLVSYQTMQHVSKYHHTARHEDLLFLPRGDDEGLASVYVAEYDDTPADVEEGLPSVGYHVFNERPSPSVSSNQVCLSFILVDIYSPSSCTNTTPSAVYVIS